jgi:hypothetical protein
MGGHTTIGDYDKAVGEGKREHFADVTDRKLNTLSTIDGVDTIDSALSVSNVELFSVFNLILKELKIMNIHLSMATDNEIYEQEIDA